MADMMLRLYDRDYLKKRVDQRWLKLMIKYQAKYGGWNGMLQQLAVRPKTTTKERWSILVEKLQRKYKIGNPLLNSIMWKARI